jgi:hypothetical protein
MYFILIKTVLSYHLSCVILFQSSLGRSHKTGFTVYECLPLKDALVSSNLPYVFNVSFQLLYHMAVSFIRG